MSQQNLNVLVLGGSRNIGYFSALRFLEQGATVTFMLRNTAVFDTDQDVQKYVKSGKALLVKGDAMKEDDVRNAWLQSESASLDKIVNILLCTVGGTPSFSLSRGIYMEPENLVTLSVLNILCGTPVAQSPHTRLIIVTSTGITQDSHKALPCALRPFYKYALAIPHKDKLGAERAIAHCTGWKWDEVKDGEPDESIMGSKKWREREGLPAPETLRNIVVIRPMLLTSGDCRADSKGADVAYRVADQDLKNSYTVSRKDVAHFTAQLGTSRWEEFSGKAVFIGY